MNADPLCIGGVEGSLLRGTCGSITCEMWINNRLALTPPHWAWMIEVTPGRALVTPVRVSGCSPCRTLSNEHLAANDGLSGWPAAAATVGASNAEAGNRSGFTGFAFDVPLPGAPGRGHGRVYANNRTASVV